MVKAVNEAIEHLPENRLRDETKPLERHTALTPNHAKVLVDAGFKVTVEHSALRCFADSDGTAMESPTG